MPSFMSLPRELRDQICEYVILSPARQPRALNQTTEEMLDGYVTYKFPQLFVGPGASYRPQAIVSNATKLLLVNQQLRTETMEMLEQLRSTVYDLDIAMTDNGILAATWINVPVLSTKIEQLNVTFRLCVTNDGERLKSEIGDMSGAPANPGPEDFFGLPPEQLVWDFYGIFQRFTRVGPLGERENDNENRQISIKTISINVETPSPDLVQLGLIHMSDQADNAMSFTSRYFLECLNWTVRQQLKGNWEYIQNITLLEHVDDIVLYHDGNEIHRWDVAAWLAKYPEEEMIKWRPDGKKEAWRKRKQRGLKVPEDFNDPSCW
ncbi:hypothetical protein J4E91_005237 [Alternaria rosae]|nr:hypothetical protein J4E91_005237 [Alternaria rosae]